MIDALKQKLRLACSKLTCFKSAPLGVTSFKLPRPLFAILLLLSFVFSITIARPSQAFSGMAINLSNQTLPGLVSGPIAQASRRMLVTYTPPEKPFSKELQKIYQKTRVFEKLSGLIDSKVKLPRNVKVIMRECGRTNAFYRPDQHSITMCYELTEYFVALFKKNGKSDYKAGEMAMYATVFTFFHEVGHMLTHELDLPITGREEDAADQFSTLLLSQSEVGERSALAAASWFNYATGPATRAQFMDEHSLDQQRLYYIVCLLYGDEPRRYVGLTNKMGFPKQRLAQCVKEYDQKTRAWRRLLAPYVRQGSLI